MGNRSRTLNYLSAKTKRLYPTAILMDDEVFIENSLYSLGTSMMGHNQTTTDFRSDCFDPDEYLLKNLSVCTRYKPAN